MGIYLLGGFALFIALVYALYRIALSRAKADMAAGKSATSCSTGCKSCDTPR
jgi:hypothetical protein